MKQQAKKGIQNHESEVKEDYICLQQNVYDMTRLIKGFLNFYHSRCRWALEWSIKSRLNRSYHHLPLPSISSLNLASPEIQYLRWR